MFQLLKAAPNVNSATRLSFDIQHNKENNCCIAHSRSSKVIQFSHRCLRIKHYTGHGKLILSLHFNLVITVYRFTVGDTEQTGQGLCECRVHTLLFDPLSAMLHRQTFINTWCPDSSSDRHEKRHPLLYHSYHQPLPVLKSSTRRTSTKCGGTDKSR